MCRSKFVEGQIKVFDQTREEGTECHSFLEEKVIITEVCVVNSLNDAWQLSKELRIQGEFFIKE